MNGDHYTLRIFSQHGLYRLDVEPKCSSKKLYSIVSKKCGISSKKRFYLYLDSKHTKKLGCSSSTSIDSLIQNGQSLYTKLQDEDNNDITDVDGKEESMDTHESKPPNTSPTLEEENKGISHFTSFDHFLSCSGFNTSQLPLSRSYKPQPLVKGVANKIPSSVTLQHQSYRCVDHIEFRNVQEMNQFVHYWGYARHMEEQRAAFLYGFYIDDSHYSMGIRAVVEALYEPPQVDRNGQIFLLDDPQKAMIDRLAKELGLECVGFIFTHLPRTELLSADDILRSAELQLNAMKTAPKHYTGYPVAPFISVTVSHDILKNAFETNAFIISDMGVALFRDGLLVASENCAKLLVKDSPPNVLLPQILEEGKSVSVIDPHWFIVRVNDSAPKKAKSLFMSWSFPIENRHNDSEGPNLITHLCKSVRDPLEIYADFHFILYVSKIFDEKTAQLVCQSVALRQPLDSSLVETFELLKSSSY